MLDWLDPLKGNGYQFWSGVRRPRAPGGSGSQAH